MRDLLKLGVLLCELSAFAKVASKATAHEIFLLFVKTISERKYSV
jgi:hypothetical protein